MSRQRAREICLDVTELLRVNPKLAIADVARSLDLSKAEVSRACRLHGEGFRRLRAQMRFKRVVNLLATKRPRSIKETAVLLGCSPRTLSRSAAKNSGLTPVKLRATLATGHKAIARRPVA
jgi:AraC-like DNA-binding protein